jgi:hypothetical protein
MHHSEPRLKELGILKLDELYKVYTNTLTFSSLQRLAPEFLQDLFTYRETKAIQTRSIATKPKDIQRVNSYPKAGPVNSFIFSAIKQWNDLPEEIQLSNSCEQLIKKLKHHYRTEQNIMSQCPL